VCVCVCVCVLVFKKNPKLNNENKKTNTLPKNRDSYSMHFTRNMAFI
jgi:hypothetical protein